MENTNLKFIFGALIVITVVSLIEGALYPDKIFSPLLNNAPKETTWNIPVLGWIINFFGWAFSSLNIIFNMITFNIPEIPLTIRLLLLIPYWGAILYIASPLIGKIAQGIGSLIPFT